MTNPDGTGLQLLTSGDRSDLRPSWSPDGTRIVFTGVSRGDDVYDLYVLSLDTLGVLQLTDDSHYDDYAGWSPDGDLIIFSSRRDGDVEIFVMNPDGTDQRQITNNTEGDWAPNWSPDGTQILFVSNRDSDPEIFVMNPDGTDQRQITNNTEGDWAPNWSPDGTQILFVSDRDGDVEIFVMNLDGTDQRQLTDNFNQSDWITNQAWLSPDYPRGSDYFVDISAGHWADEAIDWAVTNGIVSGVGRGLFSLDGAVTRAEIVTLLRRVANLLEENPVATRGSWMFDDVPAWHSADRAIGWAVTNGIVSGVGGGLFDPDRPVTCAQLATFLHRTAELVDPASTSVGEEGGRFSSIGVGWAGVCGLGASGGVECWDWKAEEGPPLGGFTSISVGYRACGTRSDRSVECWGGTNNGSQPPEGEFTAVDIGAYYACGHLKNGTVECWGSDPWLEPMIQAPEGVFVSVSAGWSHACGIRPAHRVECWGSNHAGKTEPQQGQFMLVSAGGLFSCGLRPDNSISCWGSNQYGKATPPTGDLSMLGRDGITHAPYALTAQSPAGGTKHMAKRPHPKVSSPP